MLRFVFSEKGVANEHKIMRKRSVFNVFCDTILIDLTQKAGEFPGVLADDYKFTHQVGNQLQRYGMPGVLSSSVRRPGGININIFRESVLSDPELFQHLKYIIYPKQGKVAVAGLDQPFDIEFSVAALNV